MPHEIADSDDELDLTLPKQSDSTKNGSSKAAAPSPAEQHLGDLDPLAHVDFEQFLTPTQRLSSYDCNYDDAGPLNTSNFVDSSTDRFLSEVAPATASSANANGGGESHMGGKQKSSKKRPRTEIEQSAKSASIENSRKRSKTSYSHVGSIGVTSPSNALTEYHALNNGDLRNDNNQDHADNAISGDTIHLADMVSIEPRTQYTSPLDLSLGLSESNGAADGTADNVDDNARQAQKYVPPQTYTQQNGYFGATLKGGTTNRSSMGNYQSFSINPTALSMDFTEINPFGSLSQISHTYDVESDETRGISEIFCSHRSKDMPVNERTEEDQAVTTNVVEEMQTSPEKGSVEAPALLTADEEPPQDSPSYSPITNADDGNPNVEADVPGQLLDQNAKTTNVQLAESAEEPAKPAPKKRGRKPKPKPAEVASPDIDELQMDEHFSAGALRAGTVEPVSNVSEISEAIANSRNGRRPKNKNTEIVPLEVLSKKLPSSDLGLDNKAVIGLSPERYVPRPSRRRGHAEHEVTLENPEPEDLNARDDEQIQAAPVQETSKKGKRGRKSKAKPVKVSTAAELSKNSFLLDEAQKEEVEEIIILDEQPGQIKFQPLPEPSPDRQPKKEEIEEERDQGGEGNEEKFADRRANISIDVPVLPRSDEIEQELPPAPEPKKRGRKRKKLIAEPAEEPMAEAQQNMEGRVHSVLAETDTNAQIKSATNSVDSEDEGAKVEKENLPMNMDEQPLSPPKLKASTPTKSSTPAAATKQTHSPLKPMSATPLFNARTRIGLSKRHSIPSLLRKVDRNKEPPKAIEKKEKLTKRQLEEREQERIAREEAEAEGRDYIPLNTMRGKDGMLVEWDF